MKRAVSISIGSSTRDKAVVVNLLGEQISIERIGTDGDMEKAAQLYRELDGKVEAFGVGGADLGLMVDKKWYPLHSVKPMVRFVERTPVVDGAGLKNTLENQLAPFMDRHFGEYLEEKGKKALITSGADRWGMAASFANAGYECVFGDLMFALGIGIPLRSLSSLKILASLLIPVVSRLPFEWVYPTGEKQETRVPKWEKYYAWATVIAGDCHFIKRHMPERLDGKAIATNTTTPEDVELFRKAGIKYLVTSTPVLEGRSFGTNMMEAALVAAAGKNRILTHEELSELLQTLGFEPQLQKLN
ncbi:MAG: quinate 5-dehydrogenase [Chloroflexi bacterium RBG_16_54_18]|nr:MAG: quinate 5-dehydrogenase [Chloroflexi bacterium RBG_16_54_18]